MGVIAFQTKKPDVPPVVVPLTLWSWGRNSSGQLGLGNTTSISTPSQVGLLEDWSKVGGTFDSVASIRSNGTLWTSGENDYGQCAQINTNDYSSPVQVGTDTDWAYVSSSGYDHVLAVKSDGKLWAWGKNDYGQLGIGNVTHKSSPVQVGSLEDWSSVSAGTRFTLAIKTDGSLWSWGGQSQGELGTGINFTTPQSSPVQIGTDTDWDSVSCGSEHAAALKTDGTLWTWGKNSFGQLCHGNTVPLDEPNKVGILTDWSQLDCNANNVLVIKTDNTLWGCGNSYYGQLGNSNRTDKSSPTQVGIDSVWSLVNGGHLTVSAIRVDGTLWCWGYNNYGQLGVGNTNSYSSPVQVGTDTNWNDLTTKGKESLSWEMKLPLVIQGLLA